MRRLVLSLSTIAMLSSAYLGISCRTVSADESSTQVPVPCLTASQVSQPRLDLQACSYLFSSSNPNNLIPLIQNYYTTRINCYYQGYVINDHSSTCTAGVPISGGFGGTQYNTCSINDGEDTTNHLNESCGTPGTPDGTWEHSQYQGLWVQAVKYYRNQIIQNEILGAKALTVHPSCQPLADQYITLSQQAQAISNHITSTIISIPSQVNTSGVNFCAKDDSQLQIQITAANGTPQVINLAEILPKSASCYLAISRDNRVLMFTYLVKCEMMNRVNDFLYIVKTQKAAQLQEIIENCTSAATKYGNRIGHEKLSESAGIKAGEKYFKSCYTPKVQQLFQDIVNQLVPGHFQSKNDSNDILDGFHPHFQKRMAASLPSSSFLFTFGSIFFVRKRKKKKKKNRATRNDRNLSLLLLFIIVISARCSSNHSGSEISVCTPGGMENSSSLSQQVKTCCDPSTDYSTFLPSVATNSNLCQQCNPQACPSDNPSTDGGVAGGNASSANGMASNLTGSQPVGNSIGPNPTSSSGQMNSQNALGGSLGSTGSNGNSGNFPFGIPSSLPSSAPPGAGGTGGMSGGGGGGSSNSTSGTTPSAVPQPQSSGMGFNPNVGSGTFSQSGTGGLNTGSALQSFGSFFGSGLSGMSSKSGKVTTENFGDTSNTSSGPMASIDPIDYFNRIDSKENLFQIVHHYYMSKAKSWVDQRRR